MRYIKVLLLVLLIFFSLVFFFQNQTALSTAMTLKLNLFFVPEMTSIPLPFYFIVIVAFFVGALLAVALLLRRPISVCTCYSDEPSDLLTIVFEVRGEGTDRARRFPPQGLPGKGPGHRSRSRQGEGRGQAGRSDRSRS